MGAAWKTEKLDEGALLLFVSGADSFIARTANGSPRPAEIRRLFKKNRPDADPAKYKVRGVQTGLRIAAIEDFKEARLRAAPKGTPLRLCVEEGRLQVPTGIGRKLRVVIVDDSGTVRSLLEKIFAADPSIEIVGSFGDPMVAEKKIRELEPDVVTLDIHMPGMDGVELLKRILAHKAIPAIMISSLSMEEGSLVLDALDAGAVDYIHKPSMKDLPVLAPLMLEKLHSAALSAVKAGQGERKKNEPPRGSRALAPAGTFTTKHLLCIGSSTGGTEALRHVFQNFPKHIPPTLIVQHIPAVFSKAFADRMNTICPFEVKEAEDGDLVLPDRILIAPGGMQMEIEKHSADKWCVRILDAPPMNRHKPSVDFLFNSVAKKYKGHLAAAILTGMGADGADGLVALRKKGACTIAQDEETSVVYGMPKEAAKRGGAQEILPLSEISDRLIEMLKAL